MLLRVSERRFPHLINGQDKTSLTVKMEQGISIVFVKVLSQAPAFVFSPSAVLPALLDLEREKETEKEERRKVERDLRKEGRTDPTFLIS